MVKDITAEFVWARIPKRDPESHKGSFGSVLIVAGSARYRGAAALATEGALRAGAGLVTLASVEPVLQGVQARTPECCFLPCRPDAEGGISAEEGGTIRARAEKCSVLLVGPGLGGTAGGAMNARGLVRRTVDGAPCAVVLDADGLNAAASLLASGEPLPRPGAGRPLVVTPHPGEMARLTGLSVAQIEADREGTARRFAQQYGCVAVLKGHRTLIAAPDGTLWRNTTGNAGLARGGSGDVLAGMTAGLLACGLPAADAAACAVWLHGTAADRAAQRRGEYGMLPQDLFAELGRLFAENER